MKDERIHRGAPEPTRTTLAFDIYCAWLACQMGLSLSTATRHAKEAQSELGTLWYHVADYAWLLNTGYAAVDLDSLQRPTTSIESAPPNSVNRAEVCLVRGLQEFPSTLANSHNGSLEVSRCPLQSL